jgi:L-ascorbate metabolism protein UlaG (beta-lactamase superfamily)
MVITYYGLSCFKVQSGDLVIAVNPYGKEAGLTPPRFQTDIALVSKNTPLFNNTEALAQKGDNEVFVIDGPGEYEVQGARIRGFSSLPEKGKTGALNTIYAIEFEGIRVVIMGGYEEHTLRDEIHEEIGTPDILCIPVGGGTVIDAEMAAKAIHMIEPRIIIPAHYKISGLKEKLDPVDAFLKEIGEKPKSEERLTIKKKEVPTDTQRIVLLDALAKG